MTWTYHLKHPSFDIVTLRVNHKARQRVLLANPNTLRFCEEAVQSPDKKQHHLGPRIYCNAANNILHFDYAALQALYHGGVAERALSSPEPLHWRFKSFFRIRNISVPEAGNWRILRRLREQVGRFSSSFLAVALVLGQCGIPPNS